MTPEELEALKPLEDRRVRIRFSDGQEVVAQLISASVDLDGSSHLIYDTVEGALYSPGEYVVSVVPLDGLDA